MAEPEGASATRKQGTPSRPVIFGQLFSILTGPILGLVLVLGLFAIILAINGELVRFASVQNMQVLVHKCTVPGVVALGMLLIVVSGGIDLSVGSVVALVSVVTVTVYRLVEGATESSSLASAAGVASGLAVGALCGLANGLSVTVLRLTPFVATLGMLSIARGLAYAVTRRPLSIPGSRPPWVDALARANTPYIILNPGFWTLLLLAGVIAVMLHATILGRYTYAIGSNEATARLCGVPVGRYKLILYTLAGLLTGWAGVLLFAQGASGDPNAGVGLELQVIAAVVIGGASLSGGRGTVVGALLGVIILGILDNGVSFCQVPVEVKYILIGAIIVVNTALSRWRSRQEE